jgi:hypothetical protein
MPQNRAVAEAIGIDLDRLNRYLEQRRVLHFLEGIREAGISCGQNRRRYAVVQPAQ